MAGRHAVSTQREGGREIGTRLIMDRTESAIVLLCLIVGAGTSLLYAAIMMPFPLPDVVAFPLTGLTGWLLEHLPAPAFNILVDTCGCLAFVTLLTASSVSLISGPRAWRTGHVKRRGVSMTACGLVLGAVLSGGPLCYYEYMRSTLDHAQASSRHIMEGIRQRLESGEVSTVRRRQVWLLYAQSVYRDQGIQVQIPDERGGTTAYNPSDSDVAARSSHLNLLESMRPPYLYTVVALLFMILNLGLGLFTPVHREPPIQAPFNFILAPPAADGGRRA